MDDNPDPPVTNKRKPEESPDGQSHKKKSRLTVDSSSSDDAMDIDEPFHNPSLAASRKEEASFEKAERAIRLKKEAERKAASRKAEFLDERAIRLRKEADQRAASRKSESAEDRAIRIKKDADKKAKDRRSNKKNAESAEDRNIRLRKEADQKALSRASRVENEEERKIRLADEANKKSEKRSRIPLIFKDHTKDADVNLRLGAALRTPFRGIDDLPIPISETEKTNRISAFNKEFNHSSFIFGCAACGRKALESDSLFNASFKLSSLSSLKLKLEEIPIYLEKMIYRNIVKVGEDYYFVNRDYLRSTDNINADTLALICSICSPFIRKNQRPPFSISSGMDFGRPCIRAEDAVPGSVPANMPILALRNLNLIEKLCISISIIYKVTIKFVLTRTGAVRQYGLSGHAIAVPTNAAEKLALFGATNQSGPRRDVHSKGIVTVSFVGPLDKWNRLVDGGNGVVLRSTYSSIFSVDYVQIVNWMNALRSSNPSYASLPPVKISENDRIEIENLPNLILREAHIINDGEAAGLETFIRQPHVNAPGDAPSAPPSNRDEDVLQGDGQAPTPSNGQPSEFDILDVVLGPISYHLLNPSDESSENAKNADETADSAIAELLRVISSNKSQTETEQATKPTQLNLENTVTQQSVSSSTVGDGRRGPDVTIRHGRDLLNEFTEFKFIVSTSMAHCFFVGYWSDKVMSEGERSMVFLQADNRVSDNIDATSYFFNQKLRFLSIRGNHALWQRSPQTLQRLNELLEDKDFMGNAELAKDQPNSPVGRAVRKIIMPLLVAAGRNVPFASAGSTSVAFTRLIANARYYGLAAWFMTVNPALHELLLPLRIARPHLSNAVSDLELSGDGFVVPRQNDDRRKILDDHPIGAALGFQLLNKAIFKNLIGLPMPDVGSRFNNLPPSPPLFGPSITDLPLSSSSPRSIGNVSNLEHGYRKRGVLGEVQSAVVACESSMAGMSHIHALIFPALTWNFIRDHAEFPDRNRKIGQYLDSILWNYLTPTVSGCEGLENESSGYLDLPGLTGQEAPTPLLNPISYNERKEFLRKHKQNHYFHSFTCWKKLTGKANPDACRCRLHRPKPSWNQETGVCQICLLDSVRYVATSDTNEPYREVNVYDVNILTRVKQKPVHFQRKFEDSIARTDNRILAPIFTCPTINATIRTLDDLSAFNTNMKPDIDPKGPNQWFVETNEAIAVATLAQSNLQWITDDGQGSFLYSSSYVVKNESGSLNATVVLFWEAVLLSRKFPSKAPDATTNPLRPAARLLTSFVNNTFKYTEFPVRSMLQFLLGTENFECSDIYSYVFIGSALKSVIERLKKLNKVIPDLSDIENPQRDDLDDLDIEQDNHILSGELGIGANGTLRVAGQEDDYFSRTGPLKGYNFLEFGFLIRRRPKVIVVNLDDYGENETAPQTRIPSSRNQAFPLREDHALANSHELYISDKPSVPVLAGAKVPPPPGRRLETDRTWTTRANAFGAFFVTLTDPWNDDGVPNYELSWEGLLELICSLDMENNIERCRYEYIINCAQVSAEDLTARKAQNILRNYSATNYQEYKETQEKNKRHCDAGSDERTTTEGNAVNEVRAQEIIDCIRLNFEEAASTSGGKNTIAEKQKTRDKRVMEALFDLMNGSQLDVSQGSSHASSTSELSRDSLRSATISTPNPTELSTVFEQILTKTPAKVSEMVVSVPNHALQGVLVQDGISAISIPNLRPSPIFQGTQLKAIETIIDAHSGEETRLLLLGGPGTGKSTTAGEAKRLLPPGSVLMTATTGKAAAIHSESWTIHMALSISQSQKKDSSSNADGCASRLLKPLSAKKERELKARLEGVEWIFVDEVSMLTSELFLLALQRLQQYGCFKICMIGDFAQLEPVCGNSLMRSALDGTEAGLLFRKFKLIRLQQQQRSRDPFHNRLMDRIANPPLGERPFSLQILREQCENCTSEATGDRMATPQDHLPSEENCPRLCPHRCFHLKTLNYADVLQHPGWANELLCAAGRTTVAAWSELSLRAFAISSGQVILRWRNPLSNTNLNPLLLRESVDKFPGFWEKFVVGAPILISFNLNVGAGLANGKRGILIRAIHKLAPRGSPSLYDQITAKGLKPGDVFTLSEPPIAVYIQVLDLSASQKALVGFEDEETEFGSGPVIPILINYSGTMGKISTVKIGKDRHNKDVEVSVIDSGYTFNFATTIHTVQGETVPKIIVDANYSPLHAGICKVSLYLVAFTRIRSSDDLRLVPWDLAGKHHLLELEHDSLLDDFLNCYNESGDFDPERIPARTSTTESQEISTKTSRKKLRPIAVTLLPSEARTRSDIEQQTDAYEENPSSSNNQSAITPNNIASETELARKTSHSTIYNSIISEIFDCELAKDRGVSTIINKYWSNTLRTYAETISALKTLYKGLSIDGTNLYTYIRTELLQKEYYPVNVQYALLGRHPNYIKPGNYKWLKGLLQVLSTENDKRIEVDKLAAAFDSSIKALQTKYIS